jgi:Flp pilus assembly pilin Flp
VAETENIRSSHWKFVYLTLIGGVNIMRKLLNKMQQFRKDEDGAAMVEYVAIMGLILGASLVILGTLGGQTTGIFSAVSTSLTAVPGGAA